MFASFFTVLSGLLAVHWFFDFPGQGQFLSDIKNKQVPVFPWWFGLTAHCWIQAAATYGIVWLFDPALALQIAIAEFLIHWAIDCVRVQQRISAMGDQLLHVTCKVLYALIIVMNHIHIDVWLRKM